MTLPLDRDTTWWLNQSGRRASADYLADLFTTRYPGAAASAAMEPNLVGDQMPDVQVRWIPGKPVGACSLGGYYDGDADPPTLTIGMSGGRRDGFTLLHEVGHHLMFTDDHWSLNVLSSLPAEKRRAVAEMAASAFAARALLPDRLVNPVFASGVTAAAIRDLSNESAASVAACCSRALEEPGERLVLFTDLQGKPWFAASTGAPFNPGRRISQPGIARLVDRADHDGIARQVGGEGIVYASGKANADVSIEIAVRATSVIAVVTPEVPSSRIRTDSLPVALECSSCDANFSIYESSNQCTRCGRWRCPECGECACESLQVVCQRCFLTLPTALASTGATQHDDCP